MTDRTALYRFFNEGGQLLYVGITDNVLRRWMEHSREKPWWFDLSHVTVQWHETREDALVAERVAIKTEDPLYNVNGLPRKAPSIPAQGVPLTEFKARLSEYIHLVEDDDEVVYLTKGGQRVAALMPVAMYEDASLEYEVRVRAEREQRYEAEQRRASSESD